MKRWLPALLVVGVVAGWAGQAQAQNLSQSDRLYLFLNYYNNNKQTQKIQADQRDAARRMEQMQQQQSMIERNTAAPVDTVSQYFRPGKSSPALERQTATLPSIYGGRNGSRQYFMRTNNYFNPARR